MTTTQTQPIAAAQAAPVPTETASAQAPVTSAPTETAPAQAPVTPAPTETAPAQAPVTSASAQAPVAPVPTRTFDPAHPLPFATGLPFPTRRAASPQDYLDAAKAAARYIARFQKTDEDGVYWDGAGTSRGNLTLYNGQAGIAYFIIELARATGDAGLEGTARSATRRLAKRWRDTIDGVPYPFIANLQYGLHLGVAGVGSVLAIAYRRYADPEVARALHEIVDWLRAEATGDADGGVYWADSSTPILDSGVILTLLRIHELFPSDGLRTLIDRAGRHVLASGEPGPRGGLVFNGTKAFRDYSTPNFELGTSGAAYALIRLHRFTGDPAYLHAAEEAVRYLDTVSIEIGPDGKAGRTGIAVGDSGAGAGVAVESASAGVATGADDGAVDADDGAAGASEERLGADSAGKRAGAVSVSASDDDVAAAPGTDADVSAADAAGAGVGSGVLVDVPASAGAAPADGNPAATRGFLIPVRIGPDGTPFKGNGDLLDDAGDDSPDHGELAGDYTEPIFYLGACHGPAGTGRLYYELERITGRAEYLERIERNIDGFEALGAPERTSAGLWSVYYCCGHASLLQYFVGLDRTYGGAHGGRGATGEADEGARGDAHDDARGDSLGEGARGGALRDEAVRGGGVRAAVDDVIHDGAHGEAAGGDDGARTGEPRDDGREGARGGSRGDSLGEGARGDAPHTGTSRWHDLAVRTASVLLGVEEPAAPVNGAAVDGALESGIPVSDVPADGVAADDVAVDGADAPAVPADAPAVPAGGAAASAAPDGAADWPVSFLRLHPSKVARGLGYYDGAAGIATALLHLYESETGAFAIDRLADDPFPSE